MQNKDELIKHINPLGICEGDYVFYPKNLKVIKAYSATSLMQKPNLFSIIGPRLLYKFFPVEKENQETGAVEVVGFNAQEAGLFLMEQCHRKGKYDPDLMRGIGVWRDEGRIIVNNGLFLLVDGVKTSYDVLESKYTYDQPDKKYFDSSTTCSKEEIDELFKHIKTFNWIDNYAPYVLIGTLVQAIIGATFKWRAHAWIIGAQGSGKSYIQFNLIRPLLGALCRGCEHGSTAAGIKGKLQHNAFAISYDEAEIRDGDDPRILNQVVGLARISSSEESTVIKGTASGGFNEYRCQSTFIMSSIKPTLKQESDLARFAQLELEPAVDVNQNEVDKFHEVEIYCENVLTEEFSNKFIGTCISLIPEILRQKEIVASQMVEMGLSARARQQFAQIIACAKAFLGDDINLSMFKSVLDETRELTPDTEPLRELNNLLNSEIGIPTSYGREVVTVKKAIELAEKVWIEDNKYKPEDINELLCSYGIKVEDGYVYIANTSSKIQKLLGYTNWGKLFKIIPWVENGSSVISFGSRTYKSRYIRFRSTVLKDGSPPFNSATVEPKPIAGAGF